MDAEKGTDGKSCKAVLVTASIGLGLPPLWVQLCMDISHKRELKTTDGKISTTLLIPLSPPASSLKSAKTPSAQLKWWLADGHDENI